MGFSLSFSIIFSSAQQSPCWRYASCLCQANWQQTLALPKNFTNKTKTIAYVYFCSPSNHNAASSICDLRIIHNSFVTKAPQPQGGVGESNDFSIISPVWGKVQGCDFLKKQGDYETGVMTFRLSPKYRAFKIYRVAIPSPFWNSLTFHWLWPFYRPYWRSI